MSLFTGSDVQASPTWWQSHWLIAILCADVPIDLAISLMVGMPQLRSAFEPTELPVPALTQMLMDVSVVLEHAWWLILPPLVLAPLVAAWRWRERALPLLWIWLGVGILAFASICIIIALPIKTILDASS